MYYVDKEFLEIWDLLAQYRLSLGMVEFRIIVN